MKKQKILEINPNSPLIEGLLNRVLQLPAEDEEKDLEAEEELKEVVSILIDGALVRSGFEVPDSNECVDSQSTLLISSDTHCAPDSSSVSIMSFEGHWECHKALLLILR